MALPIGAFHTVAFYFTCFAECLAGDPLNTRRSKTNKRLSISQVTPIMDEKKAAETKMTSKLMRQNAVKLLKSLMGILKKYSKFKPCSPHVVYCQGLHKQILTGKTDSSIFVEAANQAKAAECHYIRALALFQGGLANGVKMETVTEAFAECMEFSKHQASSESTFNVNSLPPDAPYELRIALKVQGPGSVISVSK
mmetsp:Transcript_44714/g.71455  ORF Transcript_44714/g.71455 Transcript_44714/m.71455 type:complete len:196 (-) Transcript_44714:1272-1859(-)